MKTFLAGGKFTRYVTHVLPLVVLIAALGIDGFARVLIVLVPSAMAAHRTAPHYKINLNALDAPPERLRHFFPHCKRPDVVVTTLSEPRSACQEGRACYHFVQTGRTYYETEALFADLHARRPPDAVVRVAEVYGPDSQAHHVVKIATADEARGAGALERHEPRPTTLTALRLSRNTVVEELFLPPAP